MREMQQIVAEKRTGTGKGPSYQVRTKGNIPAVIYGGGSEPENISVNAHALERHAIKGTFLSTLFTLDVDGAKTRVIPRQLQLDPVTDRPVHVDFMRLPEGAKVRLSIPVRFKGQADSPGLKRGGVLNIVRHEVEMLCPAEHIPEYIEGDLAGLGIHDSLHIANITLPPGVTPTIKEKNFTIASIVAPTSMTEEVRAAGAAADGADAAAAPAAGAKAPAAAAGAKAPAAPAKK
ncbi:MAG TPA: 50S ribosomal protein L25/general stress protein Ctc [Rhizomicrobium sp.]|nr:50S ribosomal protein L25/general stress protein Ctc [Rhizomicrobium sp.]